MFDTNKYKNTDENNMVVFKEENHFGLFFFRGHPTEKSYQKYLLKGRHIQFYWAVDASAKVTFKLPHCVLQISQEETVMVFFKDEFMPLLFDILPGGGVATLFISVEYFHTIFTEDKSIYFNFDSLQNSKPILTKTQTKPTITMILHQILSQPVDAHLKGLYTKAKVYEILSLYFTNGTEKTGESCPFVANEKTLRAIKEAKDLMIEQMASPPTLLELSKAIGLNLQKLKVAFKNYYGMPIYAFLLDYKMNYAKKMLVENKDNVAEISAQLGYSKSSHFIVAFKKKFGITPKQYSKGV